MATGTASKLDNLLREEFQRQRAAQPQPEMQRCAHSVYIPEWARKSGKSPYCSGCNPSGEIKGVRNVIFPRSNGNGGGNFETDRPLANAKSEGRCTECASPIYEEIDERTRRCADCGAVYKAPRFRAR